MTYLTLISTLKGGPGSGNFGHAGRPGKRGGSAPNSIKVSSALVADVKSYQMANYSQKDIDAAMENFTNFIKDAPVCMRTPISVLNKILADGKFKNQHETGTSKGNFNPDFRKKAEVAAFGDRLSRPEDFPVYGYIGTGKNGFNPDVNQYGDVKIVFKDTVKQRTTVTGVDSLVPIASRRIAPSPLMKPDSVSLGAVDYYKKGAKSLHELKEYAEAQIHGKLTPKDIAKVYIPDAVKAGQRDDWNELKSKLTAAGIPYETYDIWTKPNKFESTYN